MSNTKVVVTKLSPGLFPNESVVLLRKYHRPIGQTVDDCFFVFNDKLTASGETLLLDCDLIDKDKTHALVKVGTVDEVRHFVVDLSVVRDVGGHDGEASRD